MLFGHKAKSLQVDLGDLHKKKAQLSSFLESKLKLSVSEYQNKLLITSDEVQPKEVQHVVTKFLYHHNLNNAYYVSLESNITKINAFKGESTKHKKTKRDSLHKTAVQSWGL